MGPGAKNSGPTAADQRTLATYAVLTGLTPLIPVPLLDDLAQGYFRRALVRALAEGRGRTLDGETVEALAGEPRGCCLADCLGGCLTQALLYPLRLLFRKVFFFLEWKRALDLTSQTFHYGYLVDTALAEGFLDAAGGREPAAVRRAIEQVCAAAPIKPVESAVAAAFRQSPAAVRAAARLLAENVRRLAGRPDAAREFGQATGPGEEQEKQAIRGVVEALQERLSRVPDSHFARLKSQLRAALGGEAEKAG